MFLVSNPKKSGQYYYDKRTGILYKCHFKRPVPGKEIAPFSWVLLISSLAFIILAPAYFTYQHISLLHISLLLNLSFFVLELCLHEKNTDADREGWNRIGSAKSKY